MEVTTEAMTEATTEAATEAATGRPPSPKPFGAPSSKLPKLPPRHPNLSCLVGLFNKPRRRTRVVVLAVLTVLVRHFSLPT